ncbi:UDP-glucose 4-epimerase GalE [Leeia oryzae]|uniref:UDP-glucose 4-epimerase GalE n=1 Tax=Leeia oryzae TaxID=356662 RepID=UPI00037421D9|nr:UDP-glucose 4-epimerase GalE [Leeia oryzae]
MKSDRTVLVTGGAGYIGSHTCIELLQAGCKIVVLDNLCNSRLESLKRVEEITGKTIDFVLGDVRDQVCLEQIFLKHEIDAVMHFAGLKAVGESTEKPLIYYENNVQGTLTLLQVMQRNSVHVMVFSSSATVYGDPESLPIKEDAPVQPASPYGRSKLMAEEILQDICRVDKSFKVAILRYFNPVGAHDSGFIGESSNGIPNNLMPYIAQVAIGKRDRLNIFGNDYPTPDGTGVRDYIHVVDLAKGHLKALEALQVREENLFTVNLGTGKGYSVLEVVKAFEKVSGREIRIAFSSRRRGDVAAYYADPALAHDILAWKAIAGLTEMCESTWKWQLSNPSGFN